MVSIMHMFWQEKYKNMFYMIVLQYGTALGCIVQPEIRKKFSFKIKGSERALHLMLALCTERNVV